MLSQKICENLRKEFKIKKRVHHRQLQAVGIEPKYNVNRILWFGTFVDEAIYEKNSKQFR